MRYFLGGGVYMEMFMMTRGNAVEKETKENVNVRRNWVETFAFK